MTDISQNRPYLIDSHCHLDHGHFVGGENAVDKVLARAGMQKVRGFLTVNCKIQELQAILDIADKHDNVWCSVGTHPHDAGDETEKTYSEQDIISLSAHPKIIGIGETGLDYFYKHSSAEEQKSNFRKHIHVCQATGLPLIIHARDADDDIIQILREERLNNCFKGVFHCFSSGRKLMEEAAEAGFYISFSGIVTFNRSEELREICRDVPLDRILVETDAPFLAPQVYRGKQNEPSFITHTARKIAEVKAIDEDELYRATTENFFRLFSKAYSNISGQIKRK